jgi:hypothetical protein
MLGTLAGNVDFLSEDVDDVEDFSAGAHGSKRPGDWASMPCLRFKNRQKHDFFEKCRFYPTLKYRSATFESRKGGFRYFDTCQF